MKARLHTRATGASSLESLTFHEVDGPRWKDLERLFEAPGGPKYCWCMVWRTMPKGASRSDPKAKRAALEQRVREGVPIGILGYRGDEPVAWCSIAPRPAYRELGGKDYPALAPDKVWSIACFFVPRRYRGQGMTKRLIEAAVAHARSKGAKVVEAYPVDPDAPSYRFMGFKPAFTALGFRRVGGAGLRRHVMQLPLYSGAAR